MQLRWLALLLFPLGWWFSADAVPDAVTEYTLLTLASLAATAVIFAALGHGVRAKLHLWVIVTIVLLAYFAKFYLLLGILRADPELLGDIIHPVVHSALLQEGVAIATYRVVVAAIASIAGTLVLMRLTGLLAGHGRVVGEPPGDAAVVARAYSLPWVVGATLMLSVVSLVLQVRFDIGVIRSAEMQPLPFKMASVILFTRTLLVPMMMLFTIWLADQTNRRRALVVTTCAFLLDAAGSSFATTSKSSIVLAFVALLVLWGLTDRLTLARRRFLFALLPVVVLMTGLLSVSRALRSEAGVGALDVLPAAIALLFSGGGEGLAPLVGTLTLASLMRLIGVDALLPMVAQNVPFGMARVLQVLIFAPEDVNMIYTREVMGYDLLGLAFSVSLLGFFYFLSRDILVVALGVAAYVLVWNFIFRRVHRFPGSFRPVFLTMLVQTLALSTSEGSLHGLPLQLALVTAVMMAAQWYASWFERARPRSGTSVHAPADVATR
jgi:hypothetical protein